MTGAELIKKLADDCEITRARAEDILTAHADIVVDSLVKRQPVTIPRVGSFIFTAGDSKIVRFRMAPELRERLGLKSEIHVDNCIKCGEEPPLAGRRIGKRCVNARRQAWRRSKKIKRQK